MKYRIYCRPTPGHVHCRVFCVVEGNGLYEAAICGTLTVREGEEFDALMMAFNAEFLDEETRQPMGPKQYEGAS